MNIHSAYQQRLGEVLGNVTHERSIASGGDHFYSVEINGVTLAAQIVAPNHKVAQAGFSGAPDPVQRGLMESLCRHMEGKSIQECADHVPITVERSLRDTSQPPPVRGLVTPDNADPAFALPQRLVRALLETYRTAAGYAQTANFYDPPPSARWRALTEQQRAAEIVEALKSQEIGTQLQLTALDGFKRVVVHIDAELDPASKQNLLVKAESALRQHVEPTLHVVAEVRTDRNVVRIPRDKKMP